MSELEPKKDQEATPVVYAHRCAPEVCSDGGKHQWDGETITMGWCDSVTCSKCGIAAIEVDQWAAP